MVGKSTATHAQILAPEDVTIHNYPVSWQKFHNLSCMLFIRKQGWHSGKRTWLPPLWAGCSNPSIEPKCEFVVCSLLCPERFSSGIPVFPAPKKIPNSNLTRNQVDEEPLSGCATSLNLLFIISSSSICYYFFTFFTQHFLTNILLLILMYFISFIMFSIIRQFLNSKKKSRYWPGRSMPISNL